MSATFWNMRRRARRLGELAKAAEEGEKGSSSGERIPPMAQSPEKPKGTKAGAGIASLVKKC